MKRSILVSILMVFLSLSSVLLNAGNAEASRMNPALLVMDVQNAYLPYMSEQDKKQGMEMINYTIALFRQNHFPVIRIYHTDPARGPQEGTEAFAYPDTIAVKNDDQKIVKHFANGFKKTDLDKILKEKGINTLFLCGLSATGCVLATYHGAYDFDYKVFMVKNALISHNSELTKAVQEICPTIDYYALKLLLENANN